jgi:hypothetical protein
MVVLELHIYVDRNRNVLSKIRSFFMSWKYLNYFPARYLIKGHVLSPPVCPFFSLTYFKGITAEVKLLEI